MDPDDVKNAIKDRVAGSEWKQLGRNLGIPYRVLEDIDVSFSQMVDKKSEMIQAWLTGESMPTWFHMVEALREPNLKLFKAAGKISEKHSKYNLTITLCCHNNIIP